MKSIVLFLVALSALLNIFLVNPFFDRVAGIPHNSLKIVWFFPIKATFLAITKANTNWFKVIAAALLDLLCLPLSLLVSIVTTIGYLLYKLLLMLA